MWQAGRQIGSQTGKQILLFKLMDLGTLVRHAYHLRYQGGPKSPPYTFFVMTNLGCFDLGTPKSEKEMFKQRAIFCLFVTDIQTDIQTHILLLQLKLSVDGLSSNLSVNCLQILCQLTVLLHLIISRKRSMAKH